MRMLNVKVFNQEGAEVKDLELNEAVFGIEPHKQAMFDMVLLQRASLRQGTHKVKNRTEVAGGGRKPWRQKLSLLHAVKVAIRPNDITKKAKRLKQQAFFISVIIFILF